MLREITIGGSVLLLIVVSLMLWMSRSSSIEFLVVFDDAKLLQVGDPVTQAGIVVGEVMRIEPSGDGRIFLILSLDEKHQAMTRANSTAYIPAASGRGRHNVQLFPLDAASGPILAGDRIDGADLWIELQYRRALAGGSQLSDQFGPVWKEFQTRVQRSVVDIQNYLASPEGQKLQGDAREFYDNIRDLALSEYEEFRLNNPDFERDLKYHIEEAKRRRNETLSALLQNLQERLQSEPPLE